MRRLPALDLHSHVDIEIEASELVMLDSVVFAATRSLDEAEVALTRSDPMTIWGVGCHPGLVGAQKQFDVERFRSLLASTAYASELGLDGDSRVPMEKQIQTLDLALDTLAADPRITALHSYRATSEVLEVIERHPQPGLVLHWWLGDAAETARAIELGCFFSVNPSSVERRELIRSLPSDRLLPETDHPFGDRRGSVRRPGRVQIVESALSEAYGSSADDIRKLFWKNFDTVAQAAGVRAQLPKQVRRLLMML